MLNEFWESFCFYVLVVPRTLKKVFSHSNFSYNSVQVLSSMHSNVQLLYLLLFFAVGVGVAFLVAKGPYNEYKSSPVKFILHHSYKGLHIYTIIKLKEI